MSEEIPPGLLPFWIVGVFVIAPFAVWFALWITDAI
jgi:hypothetical protein